MSFNLTYFISAHFFHQYCTVTMLTGCTEASKYIIDQDAIMQRSLVFLEPCQGVFLVGVCSLP